MSILLYDFTKNSDILFTSSCIQFPFAHFIASLAGSSSVVLGNGVALLPRGLSQRRCAVVALAVPPHLWRRREAVAKLVVGRWR